MELLIRVIDSYKLTGDDEFDSKVSRRGDVIFVAPDGWNWSEAELSHPFWRILKFPKISEPIAESLVSAEVAKSSSLDPTLQFRGFKFDCDNPALPADLAAYLADENRKDSSFISNSDDLEFATYKAAKSPWATEKLVVAAVEAKTEVIDPVDEIVPVIKVQ